MSGYSDILDGVSVSLALIAPPQAFDRVIAEHPPGSEGYPQPPLLEVLSQSKFTFINSFGVPATGAPDVDYIRDIFNGWLITASRYAEGIHRAMAEAVAGGMVHTNATIGGIDGRFRDWDWEFTYFRTAADEPRFLITGRNITKRVSLVRSRKAYEHQLELMLAEREAVVAGTEQSLEASAGLVLSLVAMRHETVAAHMRDVADFSGLIAGRLRLSERSHTMIRVAALVHNVGMLGVPSELLSKPTPLSPTEAMVVREHARIGADLLSESGFDDCIVTPVLQHHERWDGSGYPDGCAGDSIRLEARILAVADAVAVMRHPRPGSPQASSKEMADQLAAESGVGYDPEVAAVAVAILEGAGSA